MDNKDSQLSQNADRYAVVGNPIEHSKSPLIHHAFAKQTNQHIHYERVLAPLDGFHSTIKQLISRGYKGVNITVPFKFEAFQLCDTLSDRARAAGAVNTMTFSDGEIMGDNTDGIGLIRDITQNLKQVLYNKHVLLLGAGGAAQGVLQPLLACDLNNLVAANRTIEKAQDMVDQQTNHSSKVSAKTYDALDESFDIVINATSAGLSDAPLPLLNHAFAKDCLAYDLMYGRETPFMAQARANGAHVADGLGMLVEQAAEAFYIWRGVKPDTKPVMNMLKAL